MARILIPPRSAVWKSSTGRQETDNATSTNVSEHHLIEYEPQFKTVFAGYMGQPSIAYSIPIPWTYLYVQQSDVRYKNEKYRAHTLYYGNVGAIFCSPTRLTPSCPLYKPCFPNTHGTTPCTPGLAVRLGQKEEYERYTAMHPGTFASLVAEQWWVEQFNQDAISVYSDATLHKIADLSGYDITNIPELFEFWQTMSLEDMKDLPWGTIAAYPSTESKKLNQMFPNRVQLKSKLTI